MTVLIKVFNFINTFFPYISLYVYPPKSLPKYNNNASQTPANAPPKYLQTPPKTLPKTD